MGIFDRFPYSSTHEMNLDFMLGKATEIAEDMQTVATGMAQVQAGLSAISEKTEQATQAAAQAAASASSIEGSVTAAEEAAEEAQRHNESAQTWANNALTYKADCQRSATEAAASSSSAAQAATAAAASEDTVATYAHAANASAQSAANNNDSAHQYANQASASASNATFHSSNAQTAATNAQTAATNANTSATNASASADRAASLKSDVETLHRMCVAAVDQASTKAVNAANSAAQAAATKTDVETLVESLPEDFTDLNNTVNQLSDEIDGIDSDVTDLKSALKGNGFEVRTIGQYVNGAYTNSGVLTTNSTNRVRFSRMILLHEGDYIYADIPSGLNINVARFNATTKEMTAEGWTGTQPYIATEDVYILPVWRKSDNSTLDPSDIASGNVYIQKALGAQVKTINRSLSEKYIYSDYVGGSWENNTGKLTLRNDRIRFAERIFLKAGDTVHFTAYSGQWHVYSTWKKDSNATYGWTLITDYSMSGEITTEETVSFDNDTWLMVAMGATGVNDFPVSALGITITVERYFNYPAYLELLENKTQPRQTFDFGVFTKGGNIVSHRGEPYAENTMKAFQTCVANGTRVLEIDLAFTSDNVPVLLHDTTINRTGRNADGTEISGTVNIADITYEQALEYDFGIWFNESYAGQKIPTLKDTLLYFKQKNCCAIVDLTGHTYTQTQYDIMHSLFVKTGMVNNVAINADTNQIDTYTVKYKDTPINPSGSTNNIRTLKSLYNNYKNASPLIIASGAANLAEDLTFDFFAETHTLGIVTIIGFVETKQGISDLFNVGCDMVYSNTITPNEYLS